MHLSFLRKNFLPPYGMKQTSSQKTKRYLTSSNWRIVNIHFNEWDEPLYLEVDLDDNKFNRECLENFFCCTVIYEFKGRIYNTKIWT